MATSKVLPKTVGAIIEEALRSSRIIDSEQAVEADDYQTGLDALNTICAYWQTKGQHLWLLGRATLVLNVGQQSYSLGPNGDPVGSYEDTVNTTLTTAGVAADLTLLVASTTGMVAAPNILEADPTDSTTDWTAVNSATLSVSSGLRATNVSSTAGGATYELDATIGQTYRVKFSYTLGTSTSCIFSVLNGSTVEDTVTLSASSSDYLEITAATEIITFKMLNGTSTTGHYSTVYDLEYVDTEAGSRIGTTLTDGTIDWDYIYTVNSSASVTVITGLSGAAADDNVVYSFPEQIVRPLQLNNVTYASSITGTEIPVSSWSRQEYFQQPDKNSQGSVVQWYYSPLLTDGILYVWQTIGTIGPVLYFDYRIPLTIYSSIDDVLQVPVEYYTALKWALAAEVGPEYGIAESRQALLEQKAFVNFENAQDNDAEEDSLYIQPDFT